jgi:hypothetical protein
MLVRNKKEMDDLAARMEGLEIKSKEEFGKVYNSANIRDTERFREEGARKRQQIAAMVGFEGYIREY